MTRPTGASGAGVFIPFPTAGEKGVETWGGDSYKRGGGSTWITGTYDPELNLIYWGVGNPGPGYGWRRASR